MRRQSETWTMVPMIFDLTVCRTRVLALVSMFAMLVCAAVAHADGIPDALVYTFGTLGLGTSCNNLDGADPKGSLTLANGLLFGRTSTTTGKGNGDGIIFHIDPNGTGYHIDHKFTGAKTDGNNPRHNAMTLVGSVLYGTTLTGGKKDTGTIFSIDDTGNSYSTPPLYDFQMSGQKNDGDMPHSCFAFSNTLLYGMTSEGGTKSPPSGSGTIFSFDPQTNTYTRLFSFDGKQHGSDPHGQPILDPTGTTIYGMTRTGGKHNVGVIFSFAPSSHKIKTLHDFACPKNAVPLCIDKNDGATPDHGTLLLSGTTLYGLTSVGGKFGLGTIFSYDLSKKKFKVLRSFGPASTNDGQNPFGSLMLNGSVLYGTTQNGGANGLGSVFQINTDGTGYARVHNFSGGNGDGANPIDDVIIVNNVLYGMTEKGGQCSIGVIFSIALP
jgi:uncharacterized repeat protein (TIGR03803 family)